MWLVYVVGVARIAHRGCSQVATRLVAVRADSLPQPIVSASQEGEQEGYYILYAGKWRPLYVVVGTGRRVMETRCHASLTWKCSQNEDTYL